jgi:glyoxylase I family protein
MSNRFNHVGITVSNLERSIDFYTRILGLDVPPEGWNFSIEGDWLGRMVGSEDPEIRIAFIPLDHGILELLEYQRPTDGLQSATLRNWDVGAMHVCLNINDLAGFYRDNKDTVNFTSEPQVVKGGPWQGGLVVYLHDPDGISVELADTSEDIS